MSETPSTAIEARLRETVGGRAPSFIELEAAAEIASLRAQLDEFKEASERICWFDWSSNDPDAVRAIGALRFLLHGSAK